MGFYYQKMVPISLLPCFVVPSLGCRSEYDGFIYSIALVIVSGLFRKVQRYLKFDF